MSPKKQDPNTEDPKDEDPKNEDPKNTDANDEQEPLTYETWLEAQDEETKNLVNDNTSGLRSALSAERKDRKEFEAELKGLSKTLDGDPKENVDRILANLEKKELQLEFYEVAVKAGIKNPKTAFKIAEAGEFINKRGVTNFEALKEEYPELFAAGKTVDSKPGSGGNNQSPKGKGMNEMIRSSLGR
jgi:hypothetical protein